MSVRSSLIALGALLGSAVAIAQTVPSLIWISKFQDWVEVDLALSQAGGEEWGLEDCYDLKQCRVLGLLAGKNNVSKPTFLDRDERLSPTHDFRAVKAAMPTPAAQLAAARQHWEGRRYRDYRFQYRTVGEFGSREWKVTVEDGQRSDYRELCENEFGDSGEPPTIEQLFDGIDSAIQAGAVTVRARYHPKLGYPESCYIDYDERIADEEWTFFVRNLSL